MMRFGPWGRRLVALSWLAASGCTSLREIPRGAYSTVPERKRVVVETLSGDRQEFDYATFGGDTLTGFRQRDTEGGIEEFATVAIPIDSVARISARHVDWYRTMLLGGPALGAVIIAAAHHKSGGSSTTPPVTPCEPCPP